MERTKVTSSHHAGSMQAGDELALETPPTNFGVLRCCARVVSEVQGFVREKGKGSGWCRGDAGLGRSRLREEGKVG